MLISLDFRIKRLMLPTLPILAEECKDNVYQTTWKNKIKRIWLVHDIDKKSDRFVRLSLPPRWMECESKNDTDSRNSVKNEKFAPDKFFILKKQIFQKPEK